MKKRDKKKQDKLQKITKKRALYEKTRKRANKKMAAPKVTPTTTPLS